VSVPAPRLLSASHARRRTCSSHWSIVLSKCTYMERIE
jgi:hypothetical protein